MSRPDKLKVSRVELLVDLNKKATKPTRILIPGSGGVLRLALFDSKLCLYIEHDVASRREEAYIYIYRDEQEFDFKEGEQYIGTFFKDQVGYHVYLGAPW